ncbi:hypothetical protein GCM10010095_26970 [Streptomyces anthocyanicus]|uniref:hypothetical protein n=1 Tax=Streptomyces TaxID=1883 RepID=UPI000B01AEA4|nr:MULTISPECIES: hypothetical protein [Streptomyces]MBQ0950015.1 hypothetical protein [Streptomyces sp. RK76]PSK44479.1 hypothetical protein B0E38_07638 [Streptomyces sp. 111WW2]GGL40521.1 hypothetical protein GCM10010095_26970 [Streptomyces anthocyanicus]
MRTTWHATGIAMLAATAVLLATPNVAVAAGGTSPGDTEAERAVSGLLEAIARLRTHPIAGAESVDAAQTAARMQDHRVEVLQMRTETDTVFAKTAKLIQTYAKRRKLTSAHRKAVAALLGIPALKKACRF